MIPHFNTDKLLQAFPQYICYCDHSACIYSNFKWSLSTTVCPSMENKIIHL